MAEPSTPRKATFDVKPSFEASLQAHMKRNPSVTAALQAFITAKTDRPPLPLSRGMRDHMLVGQLAGYRECHLAGDSCLLYTDKGNVVTLYLVVDHDDMMGPKAKALVKKLDRA